MRSTRPRKFTGASTNLQRCKLLLMDLLTGSELRGDESRAFWNQALLEVAPQRDQQLPRQCDDADAAHAQAPAAEASAVPMAERA